MFKRIAILLLISLLSACSQQPSQQTPEEDYVIASERVSPENFEQLAIKGTEGSYNDYYAHKSSKRGAVSRTLEQVPNERRATRH